MARRFCLCFLFVLNGVRTVNPQDSGNAGHASFVPELPPDFTATGQEPQYYEDSVQILNSPVYADKEFYVNIAYKTKDVRILSVEFITYAFAHTRQEVHFKHRFVVPSIIKDGEVRNIRVRLPDALVYKENRVLGIVPDLHIEHAFLSVSMLDGGAWLNTEDLDNSFHVVTSDARRVLLVPYWLRPHKPGFCFTWLWENLLLIYEKKAGKCHVINVCLPVAVSSVIERVLGSGTQITLKIAQNSTWIMEQQEETLYKDLIDFPVALTGREEGFKRFLAPLTWPDKQLMEMHQKSHPRFTISVWMYLQEPCSGPGLCGIIHHRNEDFLTPLVALTTTGQLHIQVTYSDGSGYAFLTNDVLPSQTWIHLVLAADNTLITVSTKYGKKNFQNERTFKHDLSVKGSFHYNDSDGYWVIGGTAGFASFRGFIGHLRVYRRDALLRHEVFVPSEDHLLFRLGIEEHFHQCAKLSTKVEELILEHTYTVDPNDMEMTDRCPTNDTTLWDVIEDQEKVHWRKKFCNVPLFGETPEFDEVVLAAIRNGTSNTSTVSKSLYSTAMNMLTKNVGQAQSVQKLLKIPSCLGHSLSLHALAVMHTVGLGISQDMPKSWRYSLVGAMYDHPLSQMSVGYKHLIGVDGVKADCDVAMGYYKAAAYTAEKALAQHNEIDTHSEAVRLDDYDALAVHKGKNSDYFHWFTHQALQGVVDAQSLLGEMYYWGKHGIQRDLRQAVKFYQMGAANGNPEGLFNLGITKLKGQGIEKNETEAMELFKQAAAKDFAPAFNALGFYEINMRSNYSGGVIYFRLSAAKGDRDGLFNLGMAYDNGWVPDHPRDKKKAFKYWLDAASKGHPAACLLMGEGLSTGQHVDRNCAMGVIYLRYVAEQLPIVGQLLRNGLEAYYDGDWSRSLVYFLLASEAGMEVPQYNTALLYEENSEYLRGLTSVDCMWRYYNNSAELGWAFSMIKVGDNYWYGRTVPRNITRAAEMYGKAAAKNDHPHALYNLAFMVEYNYSLKGIYWNNVRKEDILRGNLTFAAHLYRKCRDTTENNNESFLPCAVGVVRVTLKQLWREHGLITKVSVGAVVFVLGLLSILACLADETFT